MPFVLARGRLEAYSARVSILSGFSPEILVRRIGTVGIRHGISVFEIVGDYVL
jgi:hypothetical protein